MNIGDLMMTVHKPALIKDLVPVSVALERKDLDFLTKEIIEEISKELEVSKETMFIHERDLYVIKGKIPYVTDLLYWISNNSDLIRDETKRMKYYYKRFEELVKNKDFQDLHTMLIVAGYNKVSILFYQLWHEEMEFKDRYEYILELYLDNEYGFSEFLIDEFLSLLKSYNDSRNWEKELKPFVKNGYITVYRGEEDKSTRAEKAISWTTSFKTAIFFASRYTVEGRLIKGKVKLEDVLFYTNRRNEKELISEKVYDIEPIEQISSKEILSKIENTSISHRANVSYSELYNTFKRFIQSELFKFPKGYHGTLHSKRVLLLTLSIAYLEGIKNEPLLALCDMAAFHDVGRETEGVEPDHGVKSWNKVIAKSLLESSTKEYIDIVEFVIKAHDEGDKKAKKRLQNMLKIKNKALSLKLYNIICDADSLDRVRFNDLDPSYLRTDSAKKLIIFAKNCLHYVKDV